MPDNLPPDSVEQDGQPPVTPVGQTEDWEARYKGLQREFNKLQATHKATQQSFTEKAQEFNTYRISQEDALKAAAGEQTQLQAKIEALNGEFGHAQETIQKQELLLNERLVKDEQRKLLLEAQQNDLLPLFELGHFRLDGVKDVEAAKTSAMAFRQSLQGIVQQAYTGAAPQTPAPQSTQPTGKSREELAAYLQDPANWNKPEFPAFEQAFLTLSS